jgi:hydroxyacylglutathione hydrolase
MHLKQIANDDLSQYAYLVGCQRTSEALLIDPLRDIGPYIEIAQSEELRITAVAETHIHADFVSGAFEFSRLDPSVSLYLSEEGGDFWRSAWALGLPGYRPLWQGSSFMVGNLLVEVLHTPGHTPEHLSFLLTDQGGGADEPVALFSGDFLFVGDAGRPDLLEQAAGLSGTQEDGARALFKSLNRIADLPDHLQVLPGHGAGSSCGKALGAVPSSTLGYERRFNHAFTLALEGNEDRFVSFILDGQPEPPAYFARMKSLNRTGPVPLGPELALKEFSSSDLQASLSASSWVTVDTRAVEDALSSHLIGSQFIARNFFSDFAGSFFQPTEELLLVAQSADDAKHMQSALRCIGFDKVVGFVVPETLKALPGTMLRSIPYFPADRLSADTSMDELAVIDVRKATERLQGALDGSLHFPHARILSAHQEIPEKPLVVHCQSGLRAAGVATFLARQGRTDIQCAVGAIRISTPIHSLAAS